MKVDEKIQLYIYVNKGNVVEYKGEKPIMVLIKIENRVPINLYREFIDKT